MTMSKSGVSAHIHGKVDQSRHTVDVVIIGGGPATLGLLTNACKTNR